jgi:hypothetical protein
MLTISLHKAEAEPGKPMLVGFEVEDANGSTATPSPTPTGKISVEAWSLIANDLTGLGGETETCVTTIDDPAPDKLDPATKLLAPLLDAGPRALARSEALAGKALSGIALNEPHLVFCHCEPQAK